MSQNKYSSITFLVTIVTEFNSIVTWGSWKWTKVKREGSEL